VDGRRGQSCRKNPQLSIKPKISKIHPQAQKLSTPEALTRSFAYLILGAFYRVIRSFSLIKSADKLVAVICSFCLKLRSSESDRPFTSYRPQGYNSIFRLPHFRSLLPRYLFVFVDLVRRQTCSCHWWLSFGIKIVELGPVVQTLSAFKLDT
jgi:hypothetical protein